LPACSRRSFRSHSHRTAIPTWSQAQSPPLFYFSAPPIQPNRSRLLFSSFSVPAKGKGYRKPNAGRATAYSNDLRFFRSSSSFRNNRHIGWKTARSVQRQPAFSFFFSPSPKTLLVLAIHPSRLTIRKMNPAALFYQHNAPLRAAAPPLACYPCHQFSLVNPIRERPSSICLA